MRAGELSRVGHQALFDAYTGPKQHLTHLPDDDFWLQAGSDGLAGGPAIAPPPL